MTWYEDVDARLDAIEGRLLNVEKVVARMVERSLYPMLTISEGAPAGSPPERSVSGVTPPADDDDDDLDLPPEPPRRGAAGHAPGCNGQHQRYDNATKRIVCAQCGVPLGDVTGVLEQGRVTKQGQVVATMPAEALPEWARAARESAPE